MYKSLYTMFLIDNLEISGAFWQEGQSVSMHSDALIANCEGCSLLFDGA